jgi:hypothetical protein
LWAAVLVQGSTDRNTVHALDESTRRIVSLEWYTVALGSTRTAIAWFRWDCLHASTRGRLQSFRHGWERKEFTSLVVSSGREKIRNDTLLQRWDLWILEVQELCVDCHLLTSVDFSI